MTNRTAQHPKVDSIGSMGCIILGSLEVQVKGYGCIRRSSDHGSNEAHGNMSVTTKTGKQLHVGSSLKYALRYFPKPVQGT